MCSILRHGLDLCNNVSPCTQGDLHRCPGGVLLADRTRRQSAMVTRRQRTDADHARRDVALGRGPEWPAFDLRSPRQADAFSRYGRSADRPERGTGGSPPPAAARSRTDPRRRATGPVASVAARHPSEVALTRNVRPFDTVEDLSIRPESGRVGAGHRPRLPRRAFERTLIGIPKQFRPEPPHAAPASRRPHPASPGPRTGRPGCAAHVRSRRPTAPVHPAGPCGPSPGPEPPQVTRSR
jgi:hypothetical protein